MKYTIGLDGSGVEKLLAALPTPAWLEQKCDELAERLAAIGATSASLGFSRAIYTGTNDVEVRVEHRGNGRYAVIADGESVLFIEFGAGAAYGYGHPEVQSYGPGTYPGKGHWDDPNGWYLPKEKGGEHTYGNPPAQAMYDAHKLVEEELTRIAREVFSH